MNSVTKCIAHRGLRSRAPENTLPAFRMALDRNVLGVEFDVSLSSDGVPIVIHQESLAPDPSDTALEPAPVSGTRLWTFDYSIADLRQLDAGSWFSDSFSGENIPTLREVLALDWAEKKIFIELKDPSWWRGEECPAWSAQLVDSTVKEIPPSLLGNVYFLSFSPKILSMCKQALKQSKTALNLWPLDFVDESWIKNAAHEAQAEILQYSDEMILNTPSLVRFTHSLGLACFAFETTPADTSRHSNKWNAASRCDIWKKMVNLQIDALTCDFVDEFLEL